VLKDPNEYYKDKEEQLKKSSTFMDNYGYIDFAYEYFQTGKLPKITI
jgi:hypothetical protein